MLPIVLPAKEFYDESKDEFIYTKEKKIMLEHSLLSISKWESRWKKPFLASRGSTVAGPQNREETLDYIRCMCIDKNIDALDLMALDNKTVTAIMDYVNDPMTATRINSRSTGGQRKLITSEVIYYYMTAFGIPFECEKWHLNRLLTLIQVCNEENAPKKKMGKKDVMKQNAQLNAARQKAMHSKG